jgi:hypothetical protein
MSSADPNELPVVQEPAVPCRHLRNKGMYVYTDGQSDDTHEDYDNTIYWCLKTLTGFGPDDDFVDGQDCRNTSRSCYEPF